MIGFSILFLGIDHTAQDTVIRLRANLVRMVVVGSHVTEPHPKGWLEVTTTVGTMLQPLTIGLGLALAWPGKAMVRLYRAVAVLFLAVFFMLIDIPLTLLSLKAYIFRPRWPIPYRILGENLQGRTTLLGIPMCCYWLSCVRHKSTSNARSPTAEYAEKAWRSIQSSKSENVDTTYAKIVYSNSNSNQVISHLGKKVEVPRRAPPAETLIPRS